MYKLETINELTLQAVCTDGKGELYTKAGAMIGYKGNCKFDKVLLGPQGSPMKALVGQIGRRLTGENLPLMKVNASVGSEIYYANLAQHVLIVTLGLGDEICVESENILAFTDGVDYGVKFLGQGVISQKGLFTSVLRGKVEGAQAAILTEGNPIVLETPCCVDPDAHVAHTGPDPRMKLDVSWKNLIGQASGESYVFEYTQPGEQVIIQPTERGSGIDIGIDGHGANNRPTVQNNSLFARGGFFGN